MNAGRFDTLVEVWRYTSSQNDYGEATKTWSKVSDIYARIDYGSGTESVQGEQWENKQSLILMVRYMSDLTVKDRIKHGDIYYNIITISEIDRHMYQKLQCKEVI
jgi:SPP1 family predicted phage head-tail adaptor